MAIRPLNSIAGFSTGDPAVTIVQANGDITTINFTANGLSNLGPVSNLILTGGSNGQFIQTDGAGNLSFATVDTSIISNGNSSVSIPSANGNVEISVAGNANVAVFTGTGANLLALDVQGISNLGNVGNVKITGGNADQYLKTDGLGNLVWSNVANASSNRAAVMPYLIPTGESYIVNENFQGLYSQAITIDGELEVDGILIEVPISFAAEPTQILFADNGNPTGNSNFTFDIASGNVRMPGNLHIHGNIIPNANVTFNLGNSTHRWNDIWLSNSTIYIGNSSISTDAGALTLTSGTGGTFEVSGNSNVSILQNGNSNIAIQTDSNISFAVAGVPNVLVLTSNGIYFTGTIDFEGNIDLSGNLTANGIKTDNYYYANGSPVDFQQAAGSNTQIQFNNNNDFGASANFTFNTATNLLTVAGTANVTNLNVSGNGIIDGNLTVNGNLIYVNVEELTIEDPIVNLQTGPNGAPLVSNTNKDVGTALNYYDTQARVAFMGWDNSNAEFAFGSQTTISSEVVTFNTLGNIRAQTFKGNIEATTIAGNLTTATQSNITTVGTLGSLSVTGNISAGNINAGNLLNANYLVSNSGCVMIGVGMIAVSAGTGGIFNSSVDDINLGLAANLVLGSTTGNVTVRGNLVANNNITVTGNISANLITGTLTTASQSNITTVGTLGNLSVTSNITSNISNSNTVIANSIQSKRTGIPVTTLTVIDSFAANTYRTAKYVVKSSSDLGYESLEVLLIHNDINSYVTVYGAINTGGANTVTMSTGINSGNVELRATGLGANTVVNLIGIYVPD